MNGSPTLLWSFLSFGSLWSVNGSTTFAAGASPGSPPPSLALVSPSSGSVGGTMAPGAPGPPGAPAPRATMFSSPTTSRWRMLASSKSVSSPPGNTLGKLMQSLYEPVAGKVTVRLASLITPLINSETVSAPEQVWSPAGKKTAFSPSLTSPPLKVITLSTPTWISLGSNSTPPALRIGTLSGMLMSSALSLVSRSERSILAASSAAHTSRHSSDQVSCVTGLDV
mmetsp:Transcript_60151/g.144556  ORF Transcript_60151/g.144556 Transcript_60151/m.144556 type:complete len:225 (-) Transcript_60151:1874-2548(-)